MSYKFTEEDCKRLIEMEPFVVKSEEAKQIVKLSEEDQQQFAQQILKQYE